MNNLVILQCAGCRNIVGDTIRSREEGAFILEKVSSLVRVQGDKAICGECHAHLGLWTHGKYILRADKLMAYKTSAEHAAFCTKKEMDDMRTEMRKEILEIKDVVLHLAAFVTNTKVVAASSSDIELE